MREVRADPHKAQIKLEKTRYAVEQAKGRVQFLATAETKLAAAIDAAHIEFVPRADSWKAELLAKFKRLTPEQQQIVVAKARELVDRD